MKKLIFILLALALSGPGIAQTYTPVSVTGYNHDVVANGTGVTTLSSTTADLDGSGTGYVFMAAGYTLPNGTAPTSFLPANGIINSAVATTPGVSYLLAPYAGNNSLRIPATGSSGTGSGTLTLATPLPTQEVFVMLTSGGSSTTVTVKAEFSDGTSETSGSLSVADWFNGSPFAVQGLGRVRRSGTATSFENSTTNPRLYQVRLTLTGGNIGKTLERIVVTKTGTNGVLNVMGVTVANYCADITAGTTYSNVSSGCVGSSVALSLPGASSGADVSYQWQFSTDSGANWTDINNANSSTYTGPAGDVQYRAKLSCNAGATVVFSAPKTITESPFYDCYCTPTSTGTFEYIRGVTVNTLSNISNANNGGYGNFTGTTTMTTLNKGASYPFTLRVKSNFNTSYGGAWIDYNHNGIFEQAEYHALGTSTLNGTAGNDISIASSITIPTTALTGQTRMRVRWRNGTLTGAAAEACATGYGGEVEDYYVMIDPEEACNGTPAAGSATTTATTACPGTAFSLNVTGYTGMSGLTYQWQRSASGANSFSDIGSSQTSPAFAVSSQSDSYDYRVITTCTASGLSTTSSPVTVTTNFLTCYCTNTNNGSNEYIRAVSITNTTLDNVTNANNNGGFSLFTGAANQTATLNREITYVFNVEVRANNAAGSAAAIWIDFDHSGTFDASEYVYMGSTTQTSGSTVMFTKSWQIPATALLGQTRMRVRYRNNTSVPATDACATGWSGENEDYLITIDPSLACAGAPNAASAESTVASVCENATFTLSASGIPAGTTGLMYQWQRRDAGSAASFTNLGSAQAGDAYIGSQSVSSEYRVIIKCTATGDSTVSASVNVAKSNFQTCYCIPSGGSAAGEYIKSVNVNGAGGFTAATSNTAAYNDYTANSSFTTTLTQGFSHPLTFIIHANASNSQGGIWVDYNQNGTFEASEFQQMGSSSAINTDVTFNVTLAVPATALTGDTRMRVRWHNAATGSGDACAGGWNGETEDYLLTIAAPTSCAGTPPTPTATSTAASVCSGTSFTLDASGIASGVSDYSYQWQSRTGTNAFTDLGTAQTTAAYAITSQTMATDYRLILTCTNSGLTATSSVVTVSQNSFLNCYCNPAYSSGGANDNVTSVTIGTMTNTSGSGNASPYYRDYTAQQPATIAIPDLVTGSTTNVAVTMGSDGTQYSAVWVDFDHSGTFDTNEYFSLGTDADGNGTSTIPVVIPGSAITGHTRIRVRGGHDAAITSTSACSSASFGEAEDYLVNLIAPVQCTGNPPAITASSTATSICNGTSFTLSATGIAANVSGMSYQWQSKVGSAAYTNLGAAQTTSSYIVNGQSATTMYRLVATCTASNNSTTSNAITVTQNAFTACYCTPTGGSCTNEYIRGVRLNTLNNSATTCTTGGYANFTGNTVLTTSLGLGNTYTIELDLRINATVSQAAVWIDYDHSGTFDASEYTLIGTGPATGFAALNTTFTNTITIPATALTGTTRMRVRSNNGSMGSSQACLNNYFGEVEDYLVNITQANLVISTTAAIPAGTYHDITVTGTGVATMGGPVTASGSVTVQNGGSFADNCELLTGTGTFTLEAGGTLYICNTAGIAATGASGAILLTGTRTFSKDASFVFNGTAAQLTGTGIPASVLNLTIDNTSGVTLSKASGVKRMLTLNGNLSTNGNVLTLLSTATGTAMVVNNAFTVNGNITVQRFIDPSFNAGVGYRHLSSPVVAAPISDIRASLVANPAYNTAAIPGSVTPFPTVYTFNESRLMAGDTATDGSGFTNGWMSPNSISDIMEPGKGYAANTTRNTVDLPGTLNNGAVSLGTLSYAGTTAGGNAGWHFLGNPYPSPIDWDNVTIPATMGTAVYAYRSTERFEGFYSSYVKGVGGTLTDGVIPAMQAFFVKVSAPTAFSFLNAHRVTTYADPAFYRTGRTATTSPLVQLDLLNAEGNADPLFVYVQEGATMNADMQFDAYKVQANGPSFPTFYAVTPNKEYLAISGIPAFKKETVMPLGVSVSKAGTYTFRTEQLINIPAGMQVLLEDKAKGTTTALAQGQAITVSLTATTADASRFALRLIPATGYLSNALELANVYPNPTSTTQGFTLELSGVKAENISVSVYNSIGKIIETRTVKVIKGEVAETFSTANLAKGVYTLRLSDGTTVTAKKVVVQ